MGYNHTDYYPYYPNEDYWASSDEGIDLYSAIFLSLLAFVLTLSKYLHQSPKLSSVLPEAGMIIMVGVLAGLIIYESTPISSRKNNANDDTDDENSHINEFVAEGLLSFSPKVFFFVLLPPIIFNSGYTLKREVFFRHIIPISLFACIGTAISTFVVAISLQILKDFGLMGNFQPYFTELLAFGALISATDPVSTLAIFQAKQVDPQLFYLVFGESVLNDAVGLVLFKALAKLVGLENGMEGITSTLLEFVIDFSVSFVGSMVVGVFAGLFSAYFLKIIDLRKNHLLELSIYFLIMYLPFFFAELIQLSGIVTILFTGISARRYASHNLSIETGEISDSLFRLIAHLAETSIFLELGMSVMSCEDKFNFEWKFVGWAILACLFGRALNIYPLRSLYNFYLTRKINSQLETQLNNMELQNFHDLLRSTSNFSAMTSTPIQRKDLKIRNKTAHMLWFSGLRGAVAYACAKTFPNNYDNKETFVYTTMAIVLFTVFAFGCTTDFALNILKIEMNVDEERYMEDNSVSDKMDFVNAFEKKYVNPYIIRDYNKKFKNVFELQNVSAVGNVSASRNKSYSNPKCMNPINLKLSSISSSKNLDRNDPDIMPIIKPRKVESSLYDFGLGTTARSRSTFNQGEGNSDFHQQDGCHFHQPIESVSKDQSKDVRTAFVFGSNPKKTDDSESSGTLDIF